MFSGACSNAFSTMSNLVIQSPTLSESAVTQLADIARAQGSIQLSAQAVRLTAVADDAQVRAAVAAYCDAGIDWAFVAPGARLADWKVLAMDMDSTLINIECIDEIADMAGLKPQVAAITEAAMRGEIADFAESLTRRVALLKGLNFDALERVYVERLRLNPGAETLLAAARKAGVKTLLVSGGFTWFTSRLQQRLGLDAAYANTLEVDEQGRLTGRVQGKILDADGTCANSRSSTVQRPRRPSPWATVPTILK
jgi:phosphoserine phosphatase